MIQAAYHQTPLPPGSTELSQATRLPRRVEECVPKPRQFRKLGGGHLRVRGRGTVSTYTWRSSVKTMQRDRPITRDYRTSTLKLKSPIHCSTFKRSTVAGGGLRPPPATRCHPGCRRPAVKRDGDKIGCHSYLYLVSYRRGIHCTRAIAKRCPERSKRRLCTVYM